MVVFSWGGGRAGACFCERSMRSLTSSLIATAAIPHVRLIAKLFRPAWSHSTQFFPKKALKNSCLNGKNLAAISEILSTQNI